MPGRDTLRCMRIGVVGSGMVGDVSSVAINKTHLQNESAVVGDAFCIQR